MGLKEVLKCAVKFVEKHGATKVLEAAEQIGDQSLDALVKDVPERYKVLAKAGEELAKTRLDEAIKAVETKLGATEDAPTEATGA